MKYKKQVDGINELKSLAQFRVDVPRNEQTPYRSFGIFDSNVSFIGIDKVLRFSELMESLFTTNKDIEHTYTLKSFEHEIIGLIRILEREARDCQVSDFESIVSSILDKEVVTFEVVRELYGATLSLTEISLGKFKIVNISKYQQTLFQKYPPVGAHPDIYFDHMHSPVWIIIEVKARELSKAQELSEKLFRAFDNVASYAIGDLKHNYSIRVFDVHPIGNEKTLILSTDNIGSHSGVVNLNLPYDVANEYLVDEEIGNNLIWDMITNPNLNEIQKRVLNAIEWIGKAVREREFEKSLFQFVVAIEGMLQYNEKALITPSIVSQMSDWLAFIISDLPEERKKIAKYFKTIYQKRSAIAHGGHKVVEKDDLSLALQISKYMVYAFLRTKPFSEMNNMEDLSNHITELKFA